MLDAASLGIEDLFVEWLGPLHSRATDLCITSLLSLLQLCLGEECRRLEILILRPTLKRMVVTLIAVEPHPQEEMRGVLHHQLRVAEDLVIRRRWVCLVGTGAGQDLAGKLIVGPIFSNRLTNPLPEARGPLGTQKLTVHLEQIRPLVCPILDILGARQETIDHLLPLLPRGPTVRQKGPYLLGRGR